jgi:peptide-methionine (S)-S-oxide reductase
MKRIVPAVIGLMLIVPAAPVVSGSSATAYFAGGCYWGVESVFDHVKGVKSAVSGFGFGAADSMDGVRRRPNHAGYAETVKVTYDPAKISYEQLLTIFFTVVHDPTQLDRQGPDVGPQYRSALFVTDSTQFRMARTFLDSLVRAAPRGRPVVTDLVMFGRFRAAVGSQQDFAEKNPEMPYIVINDVPKLKALKTAFPERYRG